MTELVAVLGEAGVTVLADVRLTPLSRQPGLSKRKLASSLAAAGIGYLHLPALGNPRDNREGFRRGDPGARARFEERLGTPAAQVGLTELQSRIRDGRVALLCFERDAGRCHRRLVSECLQARDPRLVIWHL